MLYNLLRLQRHHTHVDTTLHRPLRFRVRLDLHSWLQRIAFLTGEYEADTVAFLLRLHDSMGSRGYLLDVGANVGLLSIPFALALKQRTPEPCHAPLVLSVEAVRSNVTALARNVANNDADGLVTIVEAALGEMEKSVDIQIEGDLGEAEGTGTANILADDSTYQCVRVPLQLTTLDNLADSGRLPVDCRVMKIDTDGYDLKVLQGGKRYLATNRPVIFGEFSAHCLRWHNQTLRDVVRLAEEMGYSVWSRKSAGWQFATDLDYDAFKQDALLVPTEHAERFSWCRI